MVKLRFNFNLITYLLIIFFFLNYPLKASDKDISNLKKYKVAYITKLLQLVDWDHYKVQKNMPNKTKLLLCIFGSKSEYSHFSLVRNRPINNYLTIQLKYINSFSDISDCDSIYFPGKNMDNEKNFLNNMSDKFLFTIGEDELIWHGSIISIYKKKNKLAVYINISNLQQSQIKVNHSLYHIAEEVYN